MPFAAPAPSALEAATRPVLWNATSGMVAFMYAGMVVALLVAGYGLWLRARIWRLGRPERRGDRWPERLRRLTLRALGQGSVLRERVPGLAHAAVFFGVLVLLAATTVVLLQQDLGLPIMRGRFYLWFQSLAVNVCGALALAGLGVGIVRRYLARPTGLERREPADSLLLAALFLLLLSGFAISGLRIQATSDPWAAWRPVGALAGRALAALVPADELPAMHRALWLSHVALWYVVLAVAPFTKLLHAVTGPANVYFGNVDPAPALPAIDFEDPAATEVLGVRTALELTWKQLLDLDACTECGRCERACPAAASGKPLSPKRLILDLRDHVRASSRQLLAADAVRRAGHGARFRELHAQLESIAGGVISVAALWSCTTCRACEGACPVSIEHVRLILQLRQNAAMEQGLAPDGLPEMVSQLELRQHPYRGVPLDRRAWLSAAESRS